MAIGRPKQRHHVPMVMIINMIIICTVIGDGMEMRMDITDMRIQWDFLNLIQPQVLRGEGMELMPVLFLQKISGWFTI